MNSGRVLVGATLITGGVLLALDAAGVLSSGEVARAWWPLVVVGAGVVTLLGRPRAPVAGGLLVGVGLLFLGATTGLIGWDLFALAWPLALVALGFWVVFGRRLRRSERGAPDQTLDATAVFGGRTVVSQAHPLRSGAVTALFGGVELHLGGATIETEAALDLTAVFGGVEVYVPDGWRVVMSGPAFFGAQENKVAPAGPLPDDAPLLTLHAIVLFGGIEVKPEIPLFRPAPRSAGSPRQQEA